VVEEEVDGVEDETVYWEGAAGVSNELQRVLVGEVT